MSEKAELLEQVEQRELTIGQLSGETETIGWPLPFLLPLSLTYLVSECR